MRDQQAAHSAGEVASTSVTCCWRMSAMRSWEMASVAAQQPQTRPATHSSRQQGFKINKFLKSKICRKKPVDKWDSNYYYNNYGPQDPLGLYQWSNSNNYGDAMRRHVKERKEAERRQKRCCWFAFKHEKIKLKNPSNFQFQIVPLALLLSVLLSLLLLLPCQGRR